MASKDKNQADTNFGLDVNSVLNNAGFPEKTDAQKETRQIVKTALEDIILQGASDVNGVTNTDFNKPYAIALANILKGMVKADGTEFSTNTISTAKLLKDTLNIDDLTTLSIEDPAKSPFPDSVNKNDAAIYVVMAQHVKNVIRERDNAKADLDKLGYDFSKQVNDALLSVMNSSSGKPAEQLEQVIKFSNELDNNYIPEKLESARALEGASNKAIIESNTTDVAAKFKTALVERAKWRKAKDDGKIPDGDNTLETKAKRSETAFTDALSDALELAGTKDTEGKLKGAIEEKIRIKIAAHSAEWKKMAANDDDKKLDAYDFARDFMESKKTVVGFGLNLETDNKGVTTVGSGGGKNKKGSDKKGSGTGIVAAAGVLGLVTAGGALMAPRGQQLDESGQPTGEKKKLGFLRGALVAAGAVLSVVALLAMVRGSKDEGPMNKFKAGVGMGGKG